MNYVVLMETVTKIIAIICGIGLPILIVWLDNRKKINETIQRTQIGIHCMDSFHTSRCASFHLPSSDGVPAVAGTELPMDCCYGSLSADDVGHYQHHYQCPGHPAHACLLKSV